MKSNVRAVVLRVIARERERGAYLCIKKLYVYTPLTYVENITSVQVLYTDKTSVHILIEDKFVLSLDWASTFSSWSVPLLIVIYTHVCTCMEFVDFYFFCSVCRFLTRWSGYIWNNILLQNTSWVSLFLH